MLFELGAVVVVGAGEAVTAVTGLGGGSVVVGGDVEVVVGVGRGAGGVVVTGTCVR